MNKLYSIAFTSNTEEFPLFFVGQKVLFGIDCCTILKDGILTSGSPFNSIVIDQWKTNTNLKKIILKLKIIGKYKIILKSSSKVEQNQIILEETVIGNEKHGFSFTFDLEMYSESIINFTIEAISECKFLGGGYYVSEKPIHMPRLALVICTYNRTNELKQLIQQIRSHSSRYDYRDYDIYVVDNGRNIEDDYIVKNSKLIPNINLGGSGGFARGMIEVIKKSGYTHVLLMDDDIELPQTSFELLLGTLRYLKDELKDQFIPAAMYSQSNRTRQTTWIEGTSIGKNHNVASIKNNLRMLERFKQKYNSMKPGSVTCSWWLCCIPFTHVIDYGLPMPYFIKWDDSEYSLRAKFNFKPVILLGFAVWHMDFSNKGSKQIEYYRERNRLYTALIYSRRFIRDEVLYALKSFRRYFRKRSLSERLSILISANRDVLKGSQWFLSHDRIAWHNQLDGQIRTKLLFFELMIYMIQMFILIICSPWYRKAMKKVAGIAVRAEYWEKQLKINLDKM